MLMKNLGKPFMDLGFKITARDPVFEFFSARHHSVGGRQARSPPPWSYLLCRAL